MSTSLAIIGDVHGDYRRLRSALDELLQSTYRRLVFVGDYINRGPCSQRVLDALVGLQERCDLPVTFLRGNHEEFLLRFLVSGDFSSFLHCGGLTMVSNFYPSPPPDVLQRFRKEFPVEVRRWLERTESYYEDDDFLVSHTGYDPGNATDRKHESMVLRAHPSLLESGNGSLGKLAIFGHYVQASGRPLDLGDRICIDTGCGTIPGNPLTVLLLPERRFIQF